MTSRRYFHGLLGLLTLTVTVGGLMVSCAGTPTPPPGGQVDGATSGCRVQVDTVAKTKLDVGAKLNYALVNVEGSANYDAFKEVKTGFDNLQKDFDLMSGKLCEDFDAGRVSQTYYEKRRTCLDNALSAMRVLEGDLTNLKEDNGDEKVWSVESKLEWIQQSVQCKDDDAPLVAGDGSGGKPISLTAYLICQRKEGNGWTDVPECDASSGASLTEGDRVRFGFQVAQEARVYVAAYNDKGQFQMLYPDPGVDNGADPGQDYYLPSDDWFYLDDVKDVTEIIQIVASDKKIPQLEALRGADYPPEERAGKKPKMHRKAMKTRGLLEPVVYRGFKKKKKKKTTNASYQTKDVGGTKVQTAPKDYAFPGAAAIELRLKHR